MTETENEQHCATNYWQEEWFEMKSYTYHFRTCSGPNPIADFLASCSCVQNWPYRKTTYCPRRRLLILFWCPHSTDFFCFLSISISMSSGITFRHLVPRLWFLTLFLTLFLFSVLCSWLDSVLLSSSGSASLVAFCFLGDVHDLALQSFFAFLLPIVLFWTPY